MHIWHLNRGIWNLQPVVQLEFWIVPNSSRHRQVFESLVVALSVTTKTALFRSDLARLSQSGHALSRWNPSPKEKLSFHEFYVHAAFLPRISLLIIHNDVLVPNFMTMGKANRRETIIFAPSNRNSNVHMFCLGNSFMVDGYISSVCYWYNKCSLLIINRYNVFAAFHKQY